MILSSVLRLFVLTAALLLWTFASAHAAEIRCQSGIHGHYSLPQDDGWFMRRWPSGVRPTENTCSSGFLYGPIRQGDYEKVRAFFRQYHPFLGSFDLASPGGDVVEAIKIGRLFRKYLIHAFAPLRFSERVQGSHIEYFVSTGNEPECEPPHQCVCASACALIWFGGVDRSGSVGLHRPRTDDPAFRSLGPKEAAETYGRALNSIRQYLDEMEVPKPLIEAMVATSSAHIKWVDHRDDGLQRPPSLAEWQDANCSAFSEKDSKLLSDLQAKRSTLTRQEQNIRDQLQRKRLCPIELLSSHRDRLSPP